MPRQNRVDPWGDLHAVEARGLFTGNRGCLVDGHGRLVRNNKGVLWITCRTDYRDRKHPLAAPRTWTPLFFLDDAVALAAGHRPCGLCRRSDYLAFQRAIAAAAPTGEALSASELNRVLAAERYRGGRGLNRATDRILWSSEIDMLPRGTIIVDPDTREARLVTSGHLQTFAFESWGPPQERPSSGTVQVLTPPTSVTALLNGFAPRLHATAVGR